MVQKALEVGTLPTYSPDPSVLNQALLGDPRTQQMKRQAWGQDGMGKRKSAVHKSPGWVARKLRELEGMWIPSPTAVWPCGHLLTFLDLLSLGLEILHSSKDSETDKKVCLVFRMQ